MSNISTNEQYIRALQILDEYIADKKLRRTPERNYLLKLIYDKSTHFVAEELYNAIIKENFNISKATVYNSLELFLDCGVVVKHYLNNNISVYERAYGFRQHDHFVCNNCKTIIEFCDPRLYQVKKTLEEVLGVTIHSHNFYLYGLCSNPKCNK